MSIPFIEENDQTRVRREHLEKISRLVGNVYPNKFERSRVTGDEDTITAVVDNFSKHEPQVATGERPAPEAIAQANEELNKVRVRISGRISTPPRVMGKAAFVHLSDGRERLQIYVRKADVKGIHNDDGAFIEEGWELFNLLDHGDFIGVAGYLFITKTGELSVHVETLQFLSKALLPMPDKMHGISDPEIRQRQRYADLIASSLKVKTDDDEHAGEHTEELTTREVFERRSKLIREMRRFLDEHGYIEVETPMLTPKATGAAARPFETHHNALDIKLYARIAPELYLKRLLVGGFERVYELNRNFRNEGISTRHNPEFTMLEFYCAYMDVNGMMDFCEEMIRSTTFAAMGHAHARFGENEIDFGREFERLTMKEAIGKFWDSNFHIETQRYIGGERFNIAMLDDPDEVAFIAFALSEWEHGRGREYFPAIRGTGNSDASGMQVVEVTFDDAARNKLLANQMLKEQQLQSNETVEAQMARNIAYIFEWIAEVHLEQPTFIYDFPKPISPLSKASPANPSIAERFELFIAGMECANGFSELNDPDEQHARFLEQAQQRERGDEEAMVMDEDYIRALSYGMPPAAGIGIGIDRLVMLLTNRRSIRDVILFPHMRPERKPEDEQQATDS